ncbi:MAG: pentapeptide repeat-containing protein, partial [Acidobacteria bacterium]|nr:pentapeptide repeat-containing protein [Acidobacteriota bacterium]
FTGAQLWDASLRGADLRMATLRGANLRNVEGLTPVQLRAARDWDLAYYDENLALKLTLPHDHNRRIRERLGTAAEKASPPASPHPSAPPYTLRDPKDGP